MYTPLDGAQPQAEARSSVSPVIAVFLIALVVRLAAGAMLPLLRDEAWHLLAGHSWIHEGTLRVDQGAYARAGYFTVLVAWFMDAFGETLAVARWPGVLAGAALVTAAFVWLRRESGSVAAWTGAILLCFHDLSILLSAEVRFYSVHALCLWLTSVIVYRVVEGRQPAWMLALMLVIAAALSDFALHVQVTAGVALVALAAWAVCDLAYRWRPRLWFLLRSHRIAGAIIGLIVLGGALGIVFHPPAALARLYADFRGATYWAAPGRDWAFFYQRYYSETIPLVWGLFPVAFIAALVHRPRAAVFCAFLFLVPMVVMSHGGMKGGRYVFFARPDLFAIWGLAAQAVFPRAVQAGYETWERACDLFVRSWRGSMMRYQRLRRYSFAVGAILVLGFALVSQPSYRESAKIVLKSAITALSRPAQLAAGPALEPWASHRSELMAMIGRASVFIATMPSTTLYELGPFDVLLTRSFLDDVVFSGDVAPGESEFAIDRRVGRPTISTVESLRAMVTCYQTGIVIVPDEFWRNRGVVTEDMANFLMATARLTRFTGPGSPDDDLLVFEWESRADVASPQCEEVRSKVTLTS